MKKAISICVLALLILQAGAQNFDKYFDNNTLRINYTHSGDAHHEKVSGIFFAEGGPWYGTRSHLIDPNNYGELLLEAYDLGSGVKIFTRYYSCLYAEYASTYTAEKESADFQECVNMPMPKATILFTITSINRKQEKTLLYSGTYEPQKTETKPYKKEYKTVVLHKGGKSEECLDILLIPDGYTAADKKILLKDMERFADYILNCSPYKENKNRVNIHTLLAYSPEHGTNDPNAGVKRNTLLNSSFNTIGSDRYLMCENVWRMYEVADDAPSDAIIVISKTDKYGGGGIYNFYAEVSADNEKSAFVVVHEIGHSIAGLGDEYAYTDGTDLDGSFFPAGIEPVEPNVTTLVDFGSKWKDLVEPGTPIPTPVTPEYKDKVGVFEGAGYVSHGVYRPVQSCTMRDTSYDNFCPVCIRAITEIFEYYR